MFPSLALFIMDELHKIMQSPHAIPTSLNANPLGPSTQVVFIHCSVHFFQTHLVLQMYKDSKQAPFIFQISSGWKKRKEKKFFKNLSLFPQKPKSGIHCKSLMCVSTVIWKAVQGLGKECVHTKSLSHVQLSATPLTVACQAPLSMWFSRQEYWNGLPCPPPGDLPDPGIESASLMSPSLAGGFFTTSSTWEAPREREEKANTHK